MLAHKGWIRVHKRETKQTTNQATNHHPHPARFPAPSSSPRNQAKQKGRNPPHARRVVFCLSPGLICVHKGWLGWCPTVSACASLRAPLPAFAWCGCQRATLRRARARARREQAAAHPRTPPRPIRLHRARDPTATGRSDRKKNPRLCTQIGLSGGWGRVGRNVSVRHRVQAANLCGQTRRFGGSGRLRRFW